MPISLSTTHSTTYLPLTQLLIYHSSNYSSTTHPLTQLLIGSFTTHFIGKQLYAMHQMAVSPLQAWPAFPLSMPATILPNSTPIPPPRPPAAPWQVSASPSVQTRTVHASSHSSQSLARTLCKVLGFDQCSCGSRSTVPMILFEGSYYYQNPPRYGPWSAPPSRLGDSLPPSKRPRWSRQ